MISQKNKQTDNKCTGYPSIDKPWLKYYSQEQIEANLPQYKVFDYIFENNKKYQETIAFNYYDRKITYGDFFMKLKKQGKHF